MVVNDAQTRRTHIGRVNEADENFQLFSQETLAADDHAFAMKIKDTVMAAVDETRFTRVVGMMREATTVQMNTTDIPVLSVWQARISISPRKKAPAFCSV